MLLHLRIKNYAIIDDLSIDFGPGLNIITGETGAGKSILVGALGLILGDRADTSVLYDKDQKCIIEGSFTGVPALPAAVDPDEGPEILVRREISAAGKSRAFVNDSPVTLAQLQELASGLVDLHQQFDTLELGKEGFQREVLDALAHQGVVLNEYREEFRQTQAAARELAALIAQQEALAKEAGYWQFLLDELLEAALREGEIEGLEIELKRLNQSEGIRAALSAAAYTLSEGETPMASQLKSLLHQLQPYAELQPGLASLVERLNSLQIELADVSGDLENLAEGVQSDPERAAFIQDRLSIGYKLLKKHGVRDTAELLAVQAGLAEKLGAVEHLDDRKAELARSESLHRAAAGNLASRLSEGRKAVTGPFEKTVNALLVQVGMPNAKLKVEMLPATLGANGADAIEFLFDANKSGRFEPIRRVASGGELSRLMLLIKSQVAGSMQLPTLIFDEIDTGISGEAARQVGIIMKSLGLSHQVICITHQPQIAAKADAHYFVYKQDSGPRIVTRVRQLGEGERVEAIARMLSGEQVSEGMLKVAREMILN